MIKAKLVGVEDGIVSFEREFLAHIVIGRGGQTVSDKFLPEIEEATKSGRMPQLSLMS